jgi:hypothetical protein
MTVHQWCGRGSLSVLAAFRENGSPWGRDGFDAHDVDIQLQ